jgi:hypothetical protein
METKLMETSAAIALAQLLSQLIPLGIGAYKQIASANQDAGLKSIEDVVAAADANADQLVAMTQAEIARFTPAAAPSSVAAESALESASTIAPAAASALIHDFGAPRP